jgi:hypothetical protein
MLLCPVLPADNFFNTLGRACPTEIIQMDDFKKKVIASGANLTFESRLPRARAQMSNSKAPLDS